MSIPLFEVEPVDPAPRVPVLRLSAWGLELVMAGRCARLDAPTNPEVWDIVWLALDWGCAFYGPPADDDPAAVHRMLQVGELVLGAPVTAWLATQAHDAHLVIGPVEGRS